MLYLLLVFLINRIPSFVVIFLVTFCFPPNLYILLNHVFFVVLILFVKFVHRLLNWSITLNLCFDFFSCLFFELCDYSILNSLVSSFDSYDHLSPFIVLFLYRIYSILNMVVESLSHLGCCYRRGNVTLDGNGTKEPVFLPIDKKTISCKWIFAIKNKINGILTRLKAWIMAKEYAQSYAIDYSDSCSPATKLTFTYSFL